MNVLTNPESKVIWETLKANRKVFMTGKPGVGKTYNAKEIIKHAREEGYQTTITATTGIAAKGLSPLGITINSALKFGISANIDEYENSKNKYASIEFSNSVNAKQLLIIDEISMCSRDTFDLIMYIIYKRIPNIMILIIGDFMQLPPVTTDYREIFYAFESAYFNEFSVVNLTENKRNEDPNWNIFLDRIRLGIYNHDDENFLLSLPNVEIVNDNDHDFDYTIIESKNKAVDTINFNRLTQLDGNFYEDECTYVEHVYAKNKNDSEDSEITKFRNKQKDNFVKGFPLPYMLVLKIGAKVILTKNNREENYVNGDTGTIHSIHHDENGEMSYIMVTLADSNRTVKIERTRYELLHPTLKSPIDVTEPLLVSYISHFPMRLAYALSFHKTQGMSLTNVFVNPKEIFTTSQLYIGLSRLRSGGKLKLTTSDLERFVRVDRKCLDYYINLDKYKNN